MKSIGFVLAFSMLWGVASSGRATHAARGQPVGEWLPVSGPMSLVAPDDAIDLEWSDEGVDVSQDLDFGCLWLDEMSTAQPETSPEEEESTSSAEKDDAAALSIKLANPIANLISVPFQSNFTVGGGVDLPNGRGSRPVKILRRLIGGRGPGGPFRRDLQHRIDFGRPMRGGRIAERLLRIGTGGDDRNQAFKYVMNVQPVIPISLSQDWNVISRTIAPIIAQSDVIGSTSQGGLGDITQSLFFSPTKSEPFIWGVGPVFLLPTSTDHNLLGSYRWGMGPTGVILKQMGPSTFGALANHIWSFARDDGRKEINASFLQPFYNYTFKSATSLNFNTESTYDWIDHQWTVPLYGGVGQVIKVGKLPVSLQLGGQYWVEGPESAPDWGIRFAVTFLFPK